MGGVNSGRKAAPMPTNGVHTCLACGDTLPLHEFNTRSKADRRPRARCKCCENVADQRRRDRGRITTINRLIAWSPTRCQTK